MFATRNEDADSVAVERIVSGGQTGVDRAALDVAIVRGVPCGGWCPRGRLAEDGPIAVHYPLEETESPEYALRTEWNVRDSDGTLIVTAGPPTGGTGLTERLARQYRKPCLVVDVDRPRDGRRIRDWIRRHDVRVLNVAGPRLSQWPEGYRVALKVLSELFDRKMETDADTGDRSRR